MAKRTKTDQRVARHARIRKRVSGTAERPRLAVYRSLKHIYVQVIDDAKGETLCSASTQEKSVGASPNKDGAKAVGLAVGKRALEKGVKKLVFDRGGFRYHGCVASLAEGVREAGVEV